DKTVLHVTSFAPLDRTEDPTAAIRIRFSAPVVQDAEVGRPLPSVPVEIKPALEVSARWSDRETLVLQPKVALRAGTRYEVTLTGPVVGAQHEHFAFVSRPL